MSKLNSEDKGFLAIVGGGILLWLVFWAAMIYVALHFLAKFW